jgi:hypothetical protein
LSHQPGANIREDEGPRNTKAHEERKAARKAEAERVNGAAMQR